VRTMLGKPLAGLSARPRYWPSGLRNYRSSRYVMKDAIEEAGSAVAHELERLLTTLGTSPRSARLMGLFGIRGRHDRDLRLAIAHRSNPQELAHGISVALYNTGSAW